MISASTQAPFHLLRRVYELHQPSGGDSFIYHFPAFVLSASAAPVGELPYLLCTLLSHNSSPCRSSLLERPICKRPTSILKYLPRVSHTPSPYPIQKNRTELLSIDIASVAMAFLRPSIRPSRPLTKCLNIQLNDSHMLLASDTAPMTLPNKHSGLTSG